MPGRDDRVPDARDPGHIFVLGVREQLAQRHPTQSLGGIAPIGGGRSDGCKVGSGELEGLDGTPLTTKLVIDPSEIVPNPRDPCVQLDQRARMPRGNGRSDRQNAAERVLELATAVLHDGHAGLQPGELSAQARDRSRRRVARRDLSRKP